MLKNMGQRGDYDWGFSEILAEGGVGLWDLVQELGLDEALKRWAGIGNGDDTRPDFWTENKKWIVPVGIGSAVLVTVLAFMPRRKK